MQNLSYENEFDLHLNESVIELFVIKILSNDFSTVLNRKTPNIP